MKISTRSRYGLKAIVDIAAQYPMATNIKNIAQRQNIPKNYLDQILAILKKSGFIKSIRGAHGGYILDCDPVNTDVGSVLRALEGSLCLVNCLSDNPNNSCNNADCNSCFTKNVWAKIYENINSAIDSISINDLVEDYKKLLRKEN